MEVRWPSPDVNGDGFGDVLVGVYDYDDGEGNEGRAYLYLGAPSGFATSFAWAEASPQASAEFGISVSSAGDVNGDGYGDVIVGADAYDNGSTDEGSAYVYLGTDSGLSTTATWTAESDQAYSYYGRSVASAGDVDGDGYGDIIVGAYRDGTANEGRAYVYLGSSAGPSGSASCSREPDNAGAYFGFSVASAGDVNGDGYGDVVVGAYGDEDGHADEGRTYLYLGSSSGLGTNADWTSESDQDSAYFGYSVASAGDVNGDDYGDVAVGAHYYDSGEANEGRVYLFLGSASGLSGGASWTAELHSSHAAKPFAVLAACQSRPCRSSVALAAYRPHECGKRWLAIPAPWSAVRPRTCPGHPSSSAAARGTARAVGTPRGCPSGLKRGGRGGA